MSRRTSSKTAATATALLLAACGPTHGTSGATDASSTTVGTTIATTDPSTTATTSTTSLDPETGVVETTDPDTPTSGAMQCPTDGCQPDAGVPSMDCDPYVQDCPRGEKCLPWSTNGIDWNATRCSPIAADADAPGEACVAQACGLGGFDSCERGAICWEVDCDTFEGTCLELCDGSPAAPTCNGAETACLGSDEILALCLETCDPKNPMCAPNQACAPAAGDEYVCANVGG